MNFYKIFRHTLAIPALLGALSIYSQDTIRLSETNNNITSSLVYDSENWVAGQTAEIGILMEIEPGWHTYWRNSGTTGLPVEITWNLPEGFKAGELIFPTPSIYDNQGLVDYVHEDQALFRTELQIPEDYDASKSYAWGADIFYLVCKDVCIPGEASLNTDTGQHPQHRAEAFEQAKDTYPIERILSANQSYLNGSEYYIVLSTSDFDLGNIQDLHFFTDVPYIDPAIRAVTTQGDQNWTIQYTLSDFAETDLSEISGVLKLTDSTGESSAYQVSYSIQTGTPPAITSTTGAAGSNFFVIAGLAFVGGLILNLMPCVFPVIGLKIMSFVNQAGEDKQKIVLHGLIFTAGVVVSFWVLSGLLLILRAGGEQLGWGFQLQEPWFVYALIILLFTFALSLNGVFEFGMSAVGVGSNLTAKSGVGGSFFSGVLATVVATPCSAPFLAPALGAALTLNPFESLMVFTVIGLGLSTPYLLLSIFPGILSKMPKPGAWMESFKQAMAFPLYATVGYLIWSVFGQIDEANQFNMLLALVGMGLGLWIFGRWGAPHRPKRTKAIALAMGILLFLGSIWMGRPQQPEEFWQKWSPQTVAELREEGKIIYVDFTARWCATCQLNKRVVFSSEELLDTFEELDVVALKADWTNEDPIITQRLAELGKAAVPVNLIYLPGQMEPIILPEIIASPQIVLDILREPTALAFDAR